MNRIHWRTAVIVVIAVIVVAAAILLSRNTASNSFHYGVDVINEGDELIEVDSFDLYDDPNATVDVGLVFPGSTKGVSPFFKVPQESHTIRWKNTRTDKNGEATFKIKLPSDFTNAGRFIKIYLNPKENTARVAFTIRDVSSGDLREIQ